MTGWRFCLAALMLAAAVSSPAAARTCDARPKDGREELHFSLHPFNLWSSQDDCWLLITETNDSETAGALDLYRQDAGVRTLVRRIELPSAAVGVAVTRDEQVAVISANDRLIFVSVPALRRDDPPVLGEMRFSDAPAALSAVLNAEETRLFVSNETRRTISVIDFTAARQAHFRNVKSLNEIIVDNAPTNLAWSSDGRALLVPVEVALKDSGLPNTCPGEGDTDRTPVNRAGALVAIDPVAGAVASRTYVGCVPVRLVASTDGKVIWISLRGEDRLKAFDATKLGQADVAPLATVAVGPSPVGLALIHGDAFALVSNADRFAKDQASSRTVSVVDTGAALAGKPAVVGKIVVGAFPRDIAVARNSQTIFITNFNSRTISVIDTSKPGWMSPP